MIITIRCQHGDVSLEAEYSTESETVLIVWRSVSGGRQSPTQLDDLDEEEYDALMQTAILKYGISPQS